MATTQQSAGIQVDDQLIAISRYNPGITLTLDDVKQINTGQLVLIGLGSLTSAPQRGKGSIEWLLYATGSEDLTRIQIDGVKTSQV